MYFWIMFSIMFYIDSITNFHSVNFNKGLYKMDIQKFNIDLQVEKTDHFIFVRSSELRSIMIEQAEHIKIVEIFDTFIRIM